MKKIICLILAVCAVLSAGSLVNAQEKDRNISVFVDGAEVEFDVSPVLENGRTLVPLRRICEALGAEVSWNDETQTATAVKGKITIKVPISPMAAHIRKNDETIILDVKARIVNGRTLVPLRAISEGMEAKVEWIDETSQVLITSVEPEGPFKNSELSKRDMLKLKSGGDNLMHMFENGFVFAWDYGSDEVWKSILKKEESALRFFEDSWNDFVIRKIKDVQANSSSVYEGDNATDPEAEDREYSGYLSLAALAELDSDAVFEGSEYADLSNGAVMLISEYTKPKASGTSYLAVAVLPDGTPHFFGAWEAGSPNRYFVEITDGRTLNWGPVEDKTKFAQAVDLKIHGD